MTIHITAADHAFDEWIKKNRHLHDGDDVVRAAYLAGVERAITVMSQSERKGSDLRGRAICLFRTLFFNEVQRENPSLGTDTNWPCMELDDGTLVYAGRHTPGDPEGNFMPASLIGFRPSDQKRVTFHASHRVLQHPPKDES